MFVTLFVVPGLMSCGRDGSYLVKLPQINHPLTADTQLPRLIMTIGLEVDSPALKTNLLQADNADSLGKTRATISQILSERERKDLVGNDNLDRLLGEIKERLNRLYSTGKVLDIYVQEYHIEDPEKPPPDPLMLAQKRQEESDKLSSFLQTYLASRDRPQSFDDLVELFDKGLPYGEASVTGAGALTYGDGLQCYPFYYESQYGLLRGFEDTLFRADLVVPGNKGLNLLFLDRQVSRAYDSAHHNFMRDLVTPFPGVQQPNLSGTSRLAFLSLLAGSEVSPQRTEDDPDQTSYWWSSLKPRMVYGYECGIVADPPVVWGPLRVLLKAEAYDAFSLMLRLPSPSLRVYAAESLLELTQREGGRDLHPQDRRLIEEMESSKVMVNSCNGCIYYDSTVASLMSERKPLVFRKILNQSEGKELTVSTFFPPER